MNIGNIKSDGLNIVSRTNERILSFTRNLRPLCNGNIFYSFIAFSFQQLADAFSFVINPFSIFFTS
jgi:hypothetical protein